MRRFHQRTSTSVFAVVLFASSVTRRGYANAFYRLPLQQTIPTHAPSGEEVDPDRFIAQIRELFLTLKQTQLVENVFEMKSLPYFDAMFPCDTVASMKSVVIVMPKYGRENRSSEMSETLRYLRGSGASNEFNSVLQDTRGAIANGGDFLATTHGLVMGYGTSRTNQISRDALGGGTTNSGQSIPATVDAIELLPDSPPLTELCAFSGSRTMLVRDDLHGKDAAGKILGIQNKIPWQFVRVPPGCHFLSFASGSLPVYDVLCDQDYPEAMEAMGEAGLNPFPVDWTEPKKLGISMARVCLVVRFSVGGGPGGFRDSFSHQASQRNYHPKTSRIKSGAQRMYGDQGAPLLAQLQSGELPTPVHQPTPRYRPPMHRRNNAVTPTPHPPQNP